MARVNLTLDAQTHAKLAKRAKQLRKGQASVARALIQEALARQELVERRRRLARDYAAGRPDAPKLLAELERGQLELLDDEDG